MTRNDISSMAAQVRYYLDALASVDPMYASAAQHAELRGVVDSLVDSLRKVWKLRGGCSLDGGARAGRLYVSSIVEAAQYESLECIKPPTHRSQPPPALAFARHLEGYARAVLLKGKLLVPGMAIKYPKFHNSILSTLDWLYGDESDGELEAQDPDEYEYDYDHNDADAGMLEMQDIMGYGSDDDYACW